MAATNRLTSEQLAALAPGDVVCIESELEFGRRRYATGTIVRVDGFCVTISCKAHGAASTSSATGCTMGCGWGAATPRSL